MRKLKPNDGRVLVWYGKPAVWFLFARTQEEADKAYLKLFKLLKDMGFYQCGLDRDQIYRYERAKEGDAQAARWLIECRHNYEYERVEFIYVKTP
jgi:hypothetical protein